jgi:hypothetical protein
LVTMVSSRDRAASSSDEPRGGWSTNGCSCVRSLQDPSILVWQWHVGITGESAAP